MQLYLHINGPGRYIIALKQKQTYIFIHNYIYKSQLGADTVTQLELVDLNKANDISFYGKEPS